MLPATTFVQSGYARPMDPRQSIANQTAATQDILRQLQQAIQFSQSRDRQPLTVPVVNLQTSNAGLTPVNLPTSVQATSGAEAAATIKDNTFW